MPISHYTPLELTLLHYLVTYYPVNALLLKREFIRFSMWYGVDKEQLKDLIVNLAIKLNTDKNYLE